jgi:hypothetical protein
MKNLDEPILLKQEGDGVDGDEHHKEALNYVNNQRDFFEHYGRGHVHVKPAPKGLDTFASDMETGDLYVHGRFYHDCGHDLSEEKTTFAILHELGHLEERMQMLGEPDGARKFARYLVRMKRSRAFSLADNCIADIRENRNAIARTSEAQAAVERDMYKSDLFKELDMTSAPKHIQFCQALLREHRVASEKCVVAPEVRAEIEAIEEIRSEDGTTLLDAMTHPDLPMSKRLELFDDYIWPIVQKLEKQDKEEHKKKKDKKGDKGEEGSEGANQGQGGEQGDSKADKLDSNEIFKDAYEQAEKKMPHAVPVEDIEKAFKKWQVENGKTDVEKAEEAMAKRIGVDVSKMRDYQRDARALERLVNPATGEFVVEELHNLFRRIISARMRPIVAPQYPVEEGEAMVDPVEILTQARVGNFEAKAWETLEVKEKTGKKAGEVELSFIFDLSASMKGEKLTEQRRACILAMEALKGFSDELIEVETDLEKGLEIKTEMFSFNSSSSDRIPLKPLSNELSEKQRIDVASAISVASGSTTDFIPLGVIDAGVNVAVKEKMKEGELKKIVFVFTDGDSDDTDKVATILKSLREKGVVVVGIGITEDGKSVLTTYAPNAQVAKRASDLAIVVGEQLKEHLADL